MVDAKEIGLCIAKLHGIGDYFMELYRATPDRHRYSKYYDKMLAVSGVIDTLRELQQELEPKTGRWEKLTGIAPPEYHGHKVCSVCGCLAPYNPIYVGREELSRYCPECGARMDGGRDEQ